jgi:hypothetical protein
LEPAAREGRALGSPGRTGALAIRGCYLLQPLICGEYFPAMIFLEHELRSPQPRGHAVVTVALADGEAAFFAPGQRFMIWADGVVDHTIRAEGLVGHGVIGQPESPPSTCDDGGGTRRRAVRIQ